MFHTDCRYDDDATKHMINCHVTVIGSFSSSVSVWRNAVSMVSWIVNEWFDKRNDIRKKT